MQDAPPDTKGVKWEDVPGWYNFDDIYREAVEAAPQSGAHFVEIGTLFGRSTIHMAKMIRGLRKQIRFDTIDSGLDPRSFTENPTILDCAKKYGSSRQAFEHFATAIGVRHLINAISVKDLDVVSDYADLSLDMVFLDGDHSYEATKASLIAWLPKVKPGGILAGHDYGPWWVGVVRAVDEVLGDKITVRRKSFYMKVAT